MIRTMTAVVFADIRIPTLSAIRDRVGPTRASRQLRSPPSSIRARNGRDWTPWAANCTRDQPQPSPATAPSSAHDGTDTHRPGPQSP